MQANWLKSRDAPQFPKAFFMYAFIGFSFSDQYSTCVWDKDTDEMIWWPQDIDECKGKYFTKVDFRS